MRELTEERRKEILLVKKQNKQKSERIITSDQRENTDGLINSAHIHLPRSSTPPLKYLAV